MSAITSSLPLACSLPKQTPEERHPIQWRSLYVNHIRLPLSWVPYLILARVKKDDQATICFSLRIWLSWASSERFVPYEGLILLTFSIKILTHFCSFAIWFERNGGIRFSCIVIWDHFMRGIPRLPFNVWLLFEKFFFQHGINFLNLLWKLTLA